MNMRHASILQFLLALILSLCHSSRAIPDPSLFESNNDRRLSEQMLSNLQHLEAALLRQAGRSLRSEVSSPSVALTDEQVDPNQEEVESNYNLYDLPRSLQELLERAESMRKVRRGAKKRNYNLDHLARMNFRRSFRASSLNNRHILGGL